MNYLLCVCASAAVASLALLGACRSATSEAGAAAPSTVPPASTVVTDANVEAAGHPPPPAIPDAATLRSLNFDVIPTVLDLSKLSHPRATARLNDWLRADAGASPVLTLRAFTTSGWGCLCPPFSLQTTGDLVFFTEVPEGAVDPAQDALHPGPHVEFVLQGAFTGRTETLEDNARRRGDYYRGDDRAESAALGPKPVFSVRRWCIRSAPEVPTLRQKRRNAVEQAYVDSADFAAAHGVECSK